MSVENDFIPFAVGGSANVLTQAAYAALTTLTQNGFTAGIAPSIQLNKVWRQSSIMAAVIASFIVAETGQTAIDDGTTATLLANFTNAVNAASKNKIVLTDTGTANAYAAANPVPLTALPTSTGFTQTVKIAHLNTGTSTYAPDGLATAPIYGLGGAVLQGGELPANGVATLVSFVDPLLNSGNLCWVLYECVGGAQQVAPATASQHAVQFGQISGVVGSVRNLKAYVTTAGTSLTVTADEVVVESVLGGLRYCVPNLNASVSTTVTGALGGVVGTALTASGFAGVYVGVTAAGTAGLFINTAGTTTLLPNVSASPPSGVIASALVSVWPLNASTQFKVGLLRDRRFSFVAVTLLSSGTVVGPVVLSIPGAAPANAVRIGGVLSTQSTSAGSTGVTVAADTNLIGSQVCNGGLTAGGASTMSYFVDIATAQQIAYQTANSAGTPTFLITCSSYDI